MSDNASIYGGVKPSENQVFMDKLQGVIKAGEEASELEAFAQEVANSVTMQGEQSIATPAMINIRLTSQSTREAKPTERRRWIQGSVFVRKETDDFADQFSGDKRNKEYHLDPLILSLLAQEELGMGINADTDPDQVLAIIRQRFTSATGKVPDVSVVDKALEFLLEITAFKLQNAQGEDKERIGEIYKRVEEAKNKHFDLNKVDIEITQNIIGAMNAVSQSSGMDLKETLDLYRNRIHNPPDLQALRKYYEEKGGYKYMNQEWKGFSTYLGGNFKRENLERGELSQLAQSVRQMQAILGAVRQMKAEMKTIDGFLERNGIFDDEAAAA